MRSLNLLSKLAFLCNLAFIWCLVIRYTRFPSQEDLNSMLIVMGWVMAVVINFSVCLVVIVNLLAHRAMRVPFWLMIANLAFAVIQLIYILIQQYI
jgi:hypothetical protein